jgi:cyclopropane fatty-acyl-phospholipid synthase-like methyltransferase
MPEWDQYKILFVVQYLRKFVKKGDLILDIGCGIGQYRDVTDARYLGLDLRAQTRLQNSPRMLDIIA